MKAAGAKASSVSMVDQSRGPGFLSGGSDALLQVRCTRKKKTVSETKVRWYCTVQRSLENRALGGSMDELLMVRTAMAGF